MYPSMMTCHRYAVFNGMSILAIDIPPLTGFANSRRGKEVLKSIRSFLPTRHD